MTLRLSYLTCPGGLLEDIWGAYGEGLLVGHKEALANSSTPQKWKTGTGSSRVKSQRRTAGQEPGVFWTRPTHPPLMRRRLNTCEKPYTYPWQSRSSLAESHRVWMKFAWDAKRSGHYWAVLPGTAPHYYGDQWQYLWSGRPGLWFPFL